MDPYARLVSQVEDSLTHKRRFAALRMSFKNPKLRPSGLLLSAAATPLKPAPTPRFVRCAGMDSKADEYQRKADEAEENARTSTDAAAQAMWREAAQVWREMAEKERSA
jgi:hypothetical protein